MLPHNFAAAHRTLLERGHVTLLVRQSIQRSGSGRYVVISTANAVSRLYAQALYTGPALFRAVEGGDEPTDVGSEQEHQQRSIRTHLDFDNILPGTNSPFVLECRLAHP